MSKVISHLKYVASHCETIQSYGVNVYILVISSSLNICCIDSFLFMYLINFYILLTMHLRIILVINQLNAQNLVL